MHADHAQALTTASASERPVDPWTLLTGGSAGIVAGFAADLWRLGLFAARQRMATRPASPRRAVPGWTGCDHCGAR